MRMDPAQFQEFLRNNYPDVATGMHEMNGILPRFQSLVTGMERNVNNIQNESSIPTASKPTTTLT